MKRTIRDYEATRGTERHSVHRCDIGPSQPSSAVAAAATAAARRRLEVAKSPAHELDLRRPVHEAGRRQDQVDGGDRRNQHQPEPDDDEDLLVEEVDRQRTLHDVVVNARLMMNLTTFARAAAVALRRNSIRYPAR